MKPVWTWHFVTADGSSVSANAATEDQARELAYAMLGERVGATAFEDPVARWGTLKCDAKVDLTEQGISGSG